MLEYDFDVYKHPVPVSIPTLVVSTGRSLLHEAAPLQLPLRATAAAFSGSAAAAVSQALEATEAVGKLGNVRSYLAAAAQLPYELGEAAKQMLVDEFVRLRQKDAGFGAERFQEQLTVG